MFKKLLLALLFFLILFTTSSFAQEQNITNEANQPFAVVWSSNEIIAGQNATFTVHVFSVKETPYLKAFDLTDFYVYICIQSICKSTYEQFVYELGQEKVYQLTINIPEQIIINITCESEFTCRYVYDYPSEGIIRISYKRFDKTFPLMYEESFKIEHIENKTLPVFFVNPSENPFGAVQFNFLAKPFTVNYLMIVGAILFILGAFMLAMHQKWGILLLIAGFILFVLGIVFT